MGRGLNKLERLRKMEQLYAERAYSDVEMADKMGVNRTTIYRDRLELESTLTFEQEEKGRWRIARGQAISAIRLSLYEMMVLYLAGLRGLQHTQQALSHLSTSLEKLSLVLRHPMNQQLMHSVRQVSVDGDDQTARFVFELVTQAIAERRLLRIEYQSASSTEARSRTIQCYSMEPSISGHSIYVRAFDDARQTVVSFKLERILNAQLLSETFDPPVDPMDGRDRRYAWGVWTSEREPELVVLRFSSGQIARRVQETVWHPEQSIEEQADGSLIWRAPISEWREMAPWVRGWGAEVEVLKPPAFRDEMIEEAKRLSNLYDQADEE